MTPLFHRYKSYSANLDKEAEQVKKEIYSMPFVAIAGLRLSFQCVVTFLSKLMASPSH